MGESRTVMMPDLSGSKSQCAGTVRKVLNLGKSSVHVGLLVQTHTYFV